MTTDVLKKALMDGEAEFVFAKRLNERRMVRSCYAVVFDRRKGFHIVEHKPKQLRNAIENKGGIYLFQLKDDKLIPATRFGEELVRELPEELEEDVFQQLPSYDFTAQVQSQRLLKRIGFF